MVTMLTRQKETVMRASWRARPTGNFGKKSEGQGIIERVPGGAIPRAESWRDETKPRKVQRDPRTNKSKGRRRRTGTTGTAPRQSKRERAGLRKTPVKENKGTAQGVEQSPLRLKFLAAPRFPLYGGAAQGGQPTPRSGTKKGCGAGEGGWATSKQHDTQNRIAGSMPLEHAL